MNIFENLDKLLNFLIVKYEDINNSWKSSELYSEEINLKKNLVADIETHDEIMDLIWNYQEFLQKQQFKLLPGISQLQSADKIHARIKQANSIQNKINIYMNRSIKGKVPINKCFNDLLGFRIIINADFSFEQLNEHIHECFDSLKLIDSTKNGYKAYHIYLQSGNKLFPWELQVWQKSNENSNLESHHKYKQDYTTWEKKYNNK